MPSNGARSRGQKELGHTFANESTGGSKQGKSRARSRQGVSRKSTGVTKEVLDAERASLVSEKQTQLESVVDRHDTLVRLILASSCSMLTANLYRSGRYFIWNTSS